MSANIRGRHLFVLERFRERAWQPDAFVVSYHDGDCKDDDGDEDDESQVRSVRYVPEPDIFTRLAAWSASQDNWGGSCEMLPTGESMIVRLKNSRGDTETGYAPAGELADAIASALDKWQRKVGAP